MTLLALMLKGCRAASPIKVKRHCSKDAKETGMCKPQDYKVWTGIYPSLTPHL